MNLTPENKERIDGMTYEQLLSRWRFAAVGDLWFQGETGDYWGKRMRELRTQGVDHVAVSKHLGWS